MNEICPTCGDELNKWGTMEPWMCDWPVWVQDTTGSTHLFQEPRHFLCGYPTYDEVCHTLVKRGAKLYWLCGRCWEKDFL